MNRPPQHELRVSERPIRSDYALERSYARRRIMTLVVLASIIGGVIYMAWGRGPSVPAEIPTIKAEGNYKQKPADPGGIDIPHQDVRVYDELESKAPPQMPVEHLLPPSETPQEAPHAPPSSAPVAVIVPAVLPPLSAAKPLNNDATLSETRIVKPINTTVTPAPVSAPSAVGSALSVAAPVTTVQSTVAATPEIKATPSVAAKPEALSIEQVIANTKASSTPVSKTISPGSIAVQLASASDEAKAQAMMKDLQQKYATQLGDTTLHLVRADLGSRGVYYRIQSQSLAETDANQICSALKQMNAGCILVRK